LLDVRANIILVYEKIIAIIGCGQNILATRSVEELTVDFRAVVNFLNING
jgi:hypothetical protein